MYLLLTCIHYLRFAVALVKGVVGQMDRILWVNSNQSPVLHDFVTILSMCVVTTFVGLDPDCIKNVNLMSDKAQMIRDLH